jgi:hypothetical protein
MLDQRPTAFPEGEAIDLLEASSLDLVADDGFSTGDDTPGSEVAIWGVTRPRRISARGRTRFSRTPMRQTGRVEDGAFRHQAKRRSVDGQAA